MPVRNMYFGWTQRRCLVSPPSPTAFTSTKTYFLKARKKVPSDFSVYEYVVCIYLFAFSRFNLFTLADRISDKILVGRSSKINVICAISVHLFLPLLIFPRQFFVKYLYKSCCLLHNEGSSNVAHSSSVVCDKRRDSTA